MTGAFSQSLRLDTLGEAPRLLTLEAGEAERARLAERFGLQEIQFLSAEVSVTRNGGEVTASGRLAARVVQSCAASGAPVPAQVDEEFRILFRPPADSAAEEETELGAEELDVVFYEGASIDIGTAIADTLALSLDPYPRAPDAEKVLRAAGVKSEEEVQPASAFSGLKDLLKPKD